MADLNSERERLEGQLKLLELEEKYRAAYAAYNGQQSGKAYDNYKKAKAEFAAARADVRRAEGRQEQPLGFEQKGGNG